MLQRFRALYREPLPHEGYTRILRLTPSDLPDPEYTEEDVRNVMRRLRDSPEVIPPSSPGFRGGHIQGRWASGSHRAFQPHDTPFYGRGSSPRGAHRGTGAYQSTLPWSRPSSAATNGSGSSSDRWQRYTSAPEGRPYHPGRGTSASRPEYDRTQDNWRRLES